jgi:hypothetical protein
MCIYVYVYDYVHTGPLTVGLVSMAKALALCPWFKEVRTYEYMQHILQLEGTKEEKAFAAKLFSSPEPADWAQLRGDRRGNPSDAVVPPASATPQSGAATTTATTAAATATTTTAATTTATGGDGSAADDAKSTRSDASGEGDDWFRSIKK